MNPFLERLLRRWTAPKELTPEDLLLNQATELVNILNAWTAAKVKKGPLEKSRVEGVVIRLEKLIEATQDELLMATEEFQLGAILRQEEDYPGALLHVGNSLDLLKKDPKQEEHYLMVAKKYVETALFMPEIPEDKRVEICEEVLPRLEGLDIKLPGLKHRIYECQSFCYATAGDYSAAFELLAKSVLCYPKLSGQLLIDMEMGLVHYADKHLAMYLKRLEEGKGISNAERANIIKIWGQTFDRVARVLNKYGAQMPELNDWLRAAIAAGRAHNIQTIFYEIQNN